MINDFYISGFKCFTHSNFELNNLTVLTGSNGTGKSTVIQALLLIRLAVEKNALNNDSTSYFSTEWRDRPVPLNLGYELNLGTIDDIFNQNESTDTEGESIKIKLDGESFEIPLPREKDNNTSARVLLKERPTAYNDDYFLRKKEFYYLYTERLGPRLSLSSNFTEFTHCGYKGEFTAQVLHKNPFFKVEGVRLFPNLKSEYLPQQVDAWLDTICPNTHVKVEPLGSLIAQVKLRNNSVKNHVLATNIGFGISYSLPIIVTGLIAKKDSVFIVENPEAHLHPKGQSNIGYFLGKVAASGVKVIIETHSEHVVNGIRRATLSTPPFSPSNVSIYFFTDSNKKEGVKKIQIKETGDLSMFPRDFFDQVNQDMSAIFRLKDKMKNG